jgi:hypothetical protein
MERLEINSCLFGRNLFGFSLEILGKRALWLRAIEIREKEIEE